MKEITRAGGKTFYIYTHARPDGRIFYVGKGVGDRARGFSRRNEFHKRIVEKYGRDNIIIRAYPVFDELHAYACERQLILAMRKAGFELANIDDGGQGRIGVVIGEEQREKIRQSLMGHPVSEEARKRIAEAGKGRIASAQARAKMAQKKLSDSHKAALLAALTGRTVSEETRKKIGDANRGRFYTEEHRRNMSLAHIGKKHDPSSMEKRSAALRAAWARKKEQMRVAA